MQISPLLINQISIILKVVIAMILGALIGLDREVANKPAGLRTHMLVAGSASLLINVGAVMVDSQVAAFGSPVVGFNPIRIIAAIITGISFLGAGTIIRDRSEGDVTGLTTAASLLFASVVGMTTALSQWLVAFSATILALIILRIIPWVEELLTNS